MAEEQWVVVTYYFPKRRKRPVVHVWAAKSESAAKTERKRILRQAMEEAAWDPTLPDDLYVTVKKVHQVGWLDALNEERERHA